MILLGRFLGGLDGLLWRRVWICRAVGSGEECGNTPLLTWSVSVFLYVYIMGMYVDICVYLYRIYMSLERRIDCLCMV